MSPIIFLILRVSIPAGIGFAVHETMKGKLGKYAPGAAAQAGYLGFMLSLVILTLIRGHWPLTTFETILLAAAIGGFVFLLVQPSLPAAGLVIGQQAIVLVMLLIYKVPMVFKYFFFWNLLFTAAALAFSIVPIVFLALAAKEDL